jgi:hypothetical protein
MDFNTDVPLWLVLIFFVLFLLSFLVIERHLMKAAAKRYDESADEFIEREKNAKEHHDALIKRIIRRTEDVSLTRMHIQQIARKIAKERGITLDPLVGSLSIISADEQNGLQIQQRINFELASNHDLALSVRYTDAESLWVSAAVRVFRDDHWVVLADRTKDGRFASREVKFETRGGNPTYKLIDATVRGLTVPIVGALDFIADAIPADTPKVALNKADTDNPI